MISKKQQGLIDSLNNMYCSQSKEYRNKHKDDYFSLLAYLVNAEDEKRLIDAGYAYVISESKYGFRIGDYFEGMPGNILRHIGSGIEVKATEDIMPWFTKLGLWNDALGTEMAGCRLIDDPRIQNSLGFDMDDETAIVINKDKSV